MWLIQLIPDFKRKWRNYQMRLKRVHIFRGMFRGRVPLKMASTKNLIAPSSWVLDNIGDSAAFRNRIFRRCKMSEAPISREIPDKNFIILNFNFSSLFIKLVYIFDSRSRDPAFQLLSSICTRNFPAFQLIVRPSLWAQLVWLDAAACQILDISGTLAPEGAL